MAGQGLAGSSVSYSNLTIPTPPSVVQKEAVVGSQFDIQPHTGTLPPGGRVDITLDFIPILLQKYEYNLCVDIIGVGNNIYSLPIYAECCKSEVSLITNNIVYNTCFINYTYEQTLILNNPSKVAVSKYEVLSQLETCKEQGIYDV